MTNPAAASTAARRQQVPALLILSNANRSLRSAGATVPTAADRLATLREATALVAPLSLTQPLRDRDLEDLRALAEEVRGIAEAIVDHRPISLPRKLNELSRGACAIRTVTLAPDGTLKSTLDWQANNAVAELATRVVAELSRLDPVATVRPQELYPVVL